MPVNFLLKMCSSKMQPKRAATWLAQIRKRDRPAFNAWQDPKQTWRSPGNKWYLVQWLSYCSSSHCLIFNGVFLHAMLSDYSEPSKVSSWWSSLEEQPLVWENLILRIVMIHKLIRFPGCTRTPKKSFGIKVLLVQHSSDSIVCGKVWTVAICAYHLITIVLPHGFYFGSTEAHKESCNYLGRVKYYATDSFGAECSVAQFFWAWCSCKQSTIVTWLPEY